MSTYYPPRQKTYSNAGLLLVGLLFVGISLILPGRTFIYDKPVSAVVTHASVTHTQYQGKYGMTHHRYRPHMIVQYKVGNKKYESDCGAVESGFWYQVFHGRYVDSLEEARSLLAKFDEGKKTTVYYPAGHPEFVQAQPGVHLGCPTLTLLGLAIIVMPIVLLLPGFGADGSALD